MQHAICQHAICTWGLVSALLFWGCSSPVAVSARSLDEQLSSSGQTRNYQLYLPAGYTSGQAWPLVISLHGFAEPASHLREISGWNTLAEREGFLVAYPSGLGTPLSWRTAGAGTGALSRDSQFISDLIAQVSAQYRIDPRRIYVNGFSNGGGMSYLLSCELSGQIAALGSVSGAYLLPQNQCRPERPVPMLAFHGTADPVVPYQGGPTQAFQIDFPEISDWMRRRAAALKCADKPETLPPRGSVTGVRYSSCEADAELVFYTLPGSGHTWPGGGWIPEFLVGPTSQEIDATAVMWDFFKRHSLPASP